MRAFKFTLSGDGAMFAKPYSNYVDFTFSNIHKPALLGMLGAILGLQGHSSKDKISEFPEFYEKLRKLNVAIVPNDENFEMKEFKFTNTTGHSSGRGTQVVDQRVLVNPSWDIYLAKGEVDSELFDALTEMLLNDEAVFLPCLGKNHFRADITGCEEIALESVEALNKIDSLFPKRKFAIQESFDFGEYEFEKTEELPFAYKPFINHYIEESMMHTNKSLIRRMPGDKIYTDGENTLYFI